MILLEELEKLFAESTAKSTESATSNKPVRYNDFANAIVEMIQLNLSGPQNKHQDRLTAVTKDKIAEFLNAEAARSSSVSAKSIKSPVSQAVAEIKWVVTMLEKGMKGEGIEKMAIEKLQRALAKLSLVVES